jgi:GTP pyrophosphokinase
VRRIEDIAEQIQSYHPAGDLDMLRRAYIFSAGAHQGQVRRSGEPYLSHPLEVSGILADLKLDIPTVTSGLLHDTVEDTGTTSEQIEKMFGREVAVIVDGVTKISQMQFATHAERQAENMRKMILAMALDIRVILVKLADRLHNMRTLGFLSAKKQTEIAEETIDIYAPLASRLGMHKIQLELEDLCLFHLNTDMYHQIRDGIADKRGERESFIREVNEIISRKVTEFGITCRVEGRPKHIYGIYKKILQQSLTLDQVFDIVGFRIIVDNIRDCYAALGVIHSIFKPIPGRFKDYINLPKANGYQSLHTAVIGPRAARMEVQIRTLEMHQYSENGIAAHWRYKEGDKLNDQETQRFQWLRSLLEWQRDLKDPTEFLSSVRQSLLTEDAYVYVFTPVGDVRELPAGATPVDFAYTVHTEVGHHCSGAKVNGQIVPLKYQLQNGDTIQILTNKNGTPSKDWLGFVVTTKARNRIRQWFKVEEKERATTLGKEILEKEFRKEQLSFKQLTKDGELDRVAKELSLPSVDDLVAAVGFGQVSVRMVVNRLKKQDEPTPPPIERAILPTKKHKEGIKVRGVDDVLVRFAGCCTPLPGEGIVGYITQGRGVTVHSSRCKSLIHMDAERRIDVEWEFEEGVTYPVRLQVVANDSTGVLAELSGAIAEARANILQAHAESTAEGKAVDEFTIQVRDQDHLRQVITNLRKIKSVDRVVRLGPQTAV